MWTFAQRRKSYEGVMSFVLREYELAFTQGALPVKDVDSLSMIDSISMNL